MAPFFLLKRGPAAQTIDRRARWGIVLEGGFAVVWQKALWIAQPGMERLVLGVASADVRTTPDVAGTEFACGSKTGCWPEGSAGRSTNIAAAFTPTCRS